LKYTPAGQMVDNATQMELKGRKEEREEKGEKLRVGL
jgi:hypothetical protein